MMDQINFRVQEEEKIVLQTLADYAGLSVPEYVKRLVLNDIKEIRIKTAFSLLKGNKISRKKAWILSGMSYHEFMMEWVAEGFEESVPDQVLDQELKLALSLDLHSFLKPENNDNSE